MLAIISMIACYQCKLVHAHVAQSKCLNRTFGWAWPKKWISYLILLCTWLYFCCMSLVLDDSIQYAVKIVPVTATWKLKKLNWVIAKMYGVGSCIKCNVAKRALRQCTQLFYHLYKRRQYCFLCDGISVFADPSIVILRVVITLHWALYLLYILPTVIRSRSDVHGMSAYCW